MIEMRRVISIYGTIFTPGKITTDFNHIKNSNCEQKLFIYNENFHQYLDKNDLNRGGGNAFLRPYRQDNEKNLVIKEPKIKSLGIPTAMGPESMETIQDAINNIFNYIDNNINITEIYYSSDNNMNLGLGIFANQPFARTNIQEISSLLLMMFKKLKEKYDVKLYLLESNTTLEKEL